MCACHTHTQMGYAYDCVFLCIHSRIILHPSCFSLCVPVRRLLSGSMAVYDAPWWCGASSVSWQWVGGGKTPALTISISFHGAPRWLLGGFFVALDLSLHCEVTTPCGRMHSVGSVNQLHLNLQRWKLWFPAFNSIDTNGVIFFGLFLWNPY